MINITIYKYLYSLRDFIFSKFIITKHHFNKIISKRSNEVFLSSYKIEYDMFVHFLLTISFFCNRPNDYNFTRIHKFEFIFYLTFYNNLQYVIKIKSIN